MFCKKCGNSLVDGAMFCKKCGNKVERKFSVTEESKPGAAPVPRLLEPRNTQQPQYSAPQQTAPMYGAPVPAAPRKPFPLKYILIPTGILAAAAVLIAVLVTTLNPRQSVPAANSGYGQQTPGGNIGGNTGGNAGGNIGGNTIVNTGRGFVAGGKELNLVNAVYSKDSGTTAILFEGTLNELAVLVIVGTTGSFDDASTYYQSDFGDKIEVIVCAVDTNTRDFAMGSSATQGVSDAKITCSGNTMISVSGTLSGDKFGNLSFSVNGEVTNTSIENIRTKINAYNEFATPSGGGGNVGGNGGGNQPIQCTGCSSRGRGKCRFCNGDRSCHICVDGMSHCLSCNGSRICQYCGGSGLCHYCGGDGYY